MGVVVGARGRTVRSFALATAPLALALACGAPSTPSRAALDGVRFARADARGSATTWCYGGRPFDRARGCVYEGFDAVGVVRHHSKMSSAFRLVGAAYALDGVILLDTNDASLLGARDFPVLESPLRPGAHELAVLLRYRGHGSGVFSYLSGYRFEVKDAMHFQVPARGRAEVVVVGEENPDRTAPLEKRPRISLTVTSK
ncbi:MAG: hypothetical protein HYZ29_26725 [Myxococcales bacterium]|nr:hypothetical protein [Myxococcales bacterium]